MKNNIFMDKTFVKFVLVGIANTCFGTAIMFLFYNVFHLGYWISSISNYLFGSILSFVLNKRFTFENNNNNPIVILKFILTILICYSIAYSVAKPLVRILLCDFSDSIKDNISMVIGMCIFVILNYMGQRFFAFNNHESKK